jgi:hypothetical protein
MFFMLLMARDIQPSPHTYLHGEVLSREKKAGVVII